MLRKVRLTLVIAVIGLSLAGIGKLALIGNRSHVGDKSGTGTLVPTGRSVAASGATAMLDAAVVDCVVEGDQKSAVVKTSQGVAVISLADGKVLSKVALPGGGSLTGLALSPDGQTVVCSNSESSLLFFRLDDEHLSKLTAIKLPVAAAGGPSYPCGLEFLSRNAIAVAANRDNSVLVVDSDTGKVVKRIPVDTSPYRVAKQDSEHLLVTCWAAQNTPGATTADSAGTQVEVDKRGIGVGGSICRVDLSSGTVVARASLPLQPTECVQDSGRVFVACANGDSIVVLDATSLTLLESIKTSRLSGSAPDSLALDHAKQILYVALAGLDRVGAYDLRRNRWIGYERTAWYPTSVRLAKGGLLIATAKGLGSRSAKGSKHGVYDFTATVSYLVDPGWRATLPSQVVEQPPRRDAKPVPVPERTGEPSVFKHVVYIIKENRTYDQVLGDMKEGNGDPSLTLYGESVTPNQHAIARQFVLLDNYYCNGILSADGHAWATEANATTYYEHSFGGWTRSYPFGDDPLATSSSGYLWDNALDHGRTVRNFGEFDYATPEKHESALELLKDYQSGAALSFKQNIGVSRLRSVSERDFPGWNLQIPDVLRADRFAHRLHELEQSGEMADLTIVYLPQDHTSGGSPGYPSPRAQVADNDLGVGRVIDAVSHSKFWDSTVMFVEEDDPQAGFDHVDGHRSACLVASAYTKRHTVVSEFYNQASVIHTIERILALPPMNINDAEAPVMTDCFRPLPDLTPFSAIPNRIPLDEQSPNGKRVSFKLDHPDEVNDDLFNRQLWAIAKPERPYPRSKVGSHGVVQKDDDD